MANEMINNKQVNIWRGDDTPPTIYHIWLNNQHRMLVFDGTEWVVFLDNADVIKQIEEMMKQIDKIRQEVTALGDKTINNKPIKDNPVLNSSDLLLDTTGHFIKNGTITESLLRLDKLLTTQIIE